jgi:hypothetical protein
VRDSIGFMDGSKEAVFFNSAQRESLEMVEIPEENIWSYGWHLSNPKLIMKDKSLNYISE